MTPQENALAEKEQSFSNAIAEIAAKDKRRQRIAQVSTLAMVVAAACWLVLSALQVRKLERKTHELQITKNQLEGEIQTETKIVMMLNPFLKNFGWAPDKIPKEIKDVDQIRRSLEANEELNKLRLESHPLKPGTMFVQYYPKDLDGNKVRAALADFGFKVREKAPLVEDVPANDIVFGDRVGAENAKIVAYVLVRAGVDIKGIHRSRYASNANVIQVLANRITAEGAPLSVETIRQMSSFDLDPIY